MTLPLLPLLPQHGLALDSWCCLEGAGIPARQGKPSACDNARANLADRAATSSHMTANSRDEGLSVIWFLISGAAQEVTPAVVSVFSPAHNVHHSFASSIRCKKSVSNCPWDLLMVFKKLYKISHLSESFFFKQSWRSQVRAMDAVDANRSSLVFQRVVSMKTRLAFLFCLLVGVGVVSGGAGLLKNASFVPLPQ